MAIDRDWVALEQFLISQYPLNTMELMIDTLLEYEVEITHLAASKCLQIVLIPKVLLYRYLGKLNISTEFDAILHV